MIIYKDNTQIKKELDKILIDIDTSKADIARKMGVSRQQLSNTLNKKQLSFSDIAGILDAIGYDLVIDMRPRKETQKGK